MDHDRTIDRTADDHPVDDRPVDRTVDRRNVVKVAAGIALGVAGVGDLAACSIEEPASVTYIGAVGGDSAAGGTSAAVAPTAGASSVGASAARGSTAVASTAKGSTGGPSAVVTPSGATTSSARPTTQPASTSRSSSTSSSSSSSSTSSSTKSSTSSTSTKPPGAIIELSSIPVGGSVLAGGIVIGRPSSNQVTGRSDICTHMGCPIPVDGSGTLTCNCHLSRFNAFTGAVLKGPAAAALGSRSVSIVNGWVVG